MPGTRRRVPRGFDTGWNSGTQRRHPPTTGDHPNLKILDLNRTAWHRTAWTGRQRVFQRTGPCTTDRPKRFSAFRRVSAAVRRYQYTSTSAVPRRYPGGHLVSWGLSSGRLSSGPPDVIGASPRRLPVPAESSKLRGQFHCGCTHSSIG